MTATRFEIARMVLPLTALLMVLGGPALRAQVPPIGPSGPIACFCGGPVDCPRHRPRPIAPQEDKKPIPPPPPPAQKPHPAAVEYQEGNKAFGRGDWDKAILHYKRAINEGTKRTFPAGLSRDILTSAMAVAYNNSGVSMLRRGSFDRAISALNQALHFRKGYGLARANLVAAHNSWGSDLLRKGKAYDAIKQYEAARGYDPNNAVIRENLANAHRRIRVALGLDKMKTSTVKAVQQAIRKLPATPSLADANQRKPFATALKSTNSGKPLVGMFTSTTENRSAHRYARVIDQFRVNESIRYKSRPNATRPSIINTYCNIFVWDVTAAMGAEIPHWVLRNNWSKSAVDADGEYRVKRAEREELDVNKTMKWLAEHGQEHGWSRLDPAHGPELAQKWANSGRPVIAIRQNLKGEHGHIAVVRPGSVADVRTRRPGSRPAKGPAVTQAGENVLKASHLDKGFGPNSGIQFWVHN